MTNKETVAFIGLGVMGGPMAGHLASHGHPLRLYNRTRERADDWARRFGASNKDVTLCDAPGEAAEGAKVVITCVGNDDDLKSVTLAEGGAFESIAAGALYIDHTTVSANMARTLDKEASERGFAAIDAPVSGGQAGAENGKLAIMCGGSKEAFAKAQPVMECYGARIVHVGDAGAGQTTKMANQMCIAGVLSGLSEAIRLVQASGLDPDKVLEAISGGAAQSWQMENRWKTMVAGEFDFGFAIDWMRKDLDIALAESERLGLETPITRLVDQFYAEVQKMGGARQDTSALIRRLPKGNA